MEWNAISALGPVGLCAAVIVYLFLKYPPRSDKDAGKQFAALYDELRDDREEAMRQQREIFDRYINLMERQSVILDRISARLEDHIVEARREWDRRKNQ
ncbi:hypothetical protein KKH18_07055 [bacterium]|nr:hypothetical protein [bacterium]